MDLPEGEGKQELDEYFDFQTDRPMTLLIKAQEAQKTGTATEVYDYVKRAIALDRENGPIYHQGAILLSGAGLNSRAVELLHRGRKLAPEDPSFPYSLGLLAAEENDLEGSVRWLQETVELEPEFVRAWYNLSLALQHLGRTAEAQAVMQRVQMLQGKMP